jgi:hypothetical protein
VERIHVNSSTIRSIGYDARSAILEIEFQSGTIYHYTGVPCDVYNGMMTADSKGRYFNAHIRDRFPCWRVGSP